MGAAPENDAVVKGVIKVGLAPMAGFTDMPFRLLCGECGADFAVSEMISATALVRSDKKTADLAAIDPNEGPCALQIFGHDPDTVAEAAAMLAGRGPLAIEINMGCPVKKIVSSGDGSALMRDPDLAGRIVEKTARAAHAADLPLWVKIRAGWKRGEITAPSFAETLVGAGADRITVHGRTRDQMYAPSSDDGVIRAVKEAVGGRAEVFGNGDITDPDRALEMIRGTGCNGILVGRAALGDPWVFGRIKAALSGKDIPPLPTKEERVTAAIRLLRAVCDLYGEERGVRESRGRAARFIRGIRGSAAVRDRLNHAETADEFEAILSQLI